MELITLRARPRGKGAKDKPDIEFQGIGRVVKDEEGNETVETSGVLTSTEDALSLPGIDGDLQKLLDFAAVGYNKFQREQVVERDEFADYLEASWDEAKVDAYKRAVRALIKAANLEFEDAATLIKAKMVKAEAVTA